MKKSNIINKWGLTFYGIYILFVDGMYCCCLSIYFL